ncbi:MAG: sigma-70 family RNA polymerase sigma factor [Armatimonadetes bacterium]|nr:sigma-70 family RNA polymerase sigma factor [Armatimonadota bacterium]
MIGLIEQAQRGDWDAKSAIVNKLQNRIERMARYYAARCREDMGDLVQEGWVSILDALQEVDISIGDPQQYLLKRAKWRMLDYIKWNRRRQHEPLEDELLPETGAIHQEVVASVFSSQFVRQLNSRQQALVGHLVAGDTWREAADKLGCTSSNVAYHVRQIQRAYVRWSGEKPLAKRAARSTK